jgi:hypothetical protein
MSQPKTLPTFVKFIGGTITQTNEQTTYIAIPAAKGNRPTRLVAFHTDDPKTYVCRQDPDGSLGPAASMKYWKERFLPCDSHTCRCGKWQCAERSQ